MRQPRSSLPPLTDAVRLANRPYAVLIDGSALYTAQPGSDERRLNYVGFSDVLAREIPGLELAGDRGSCVWTMWTSADSRNQGQMKFLEFAEQRLGWEVRTSAPHQSFVVEPQALFGMGQTDPSRTGRLMRFDAPIAFAMGRLAQSHRLVVVSDSFALASTMFRVNEHWGGGEDDCVLAFYGRTLDSRWRQALRREHSPRLVDLDDFQRELFGIEEMEVRSPAREPGSLVF